MKFNKVREGEYRAYSNPFTFWLFEGEKITISIRYGDHSEIAYSQTIEDAMEFCHDYALRETVKQLKEIAPENGRTELIDYEYRFVCNGTVPGMAYRCCVEIGHSGKCFSNEKKVYFDREN